MAIRYPAYLQITDIAGLVRGASEGAGLGNAFLSHIAAVDGIFHVVSVLTAGWLAAWLAACWLAGWLGGWVAFGWTAAASVDCRLPGLSAKTACVCVCLCVCALLQQVRAFDNDDVVHVDDSVDPVRDLDTIQVGWDPLQVGRGRQGRWWCGGNVFGLLRMAAKAQAQSCLVLLSVPPLLPSDAAAHVGRVWQPLRFLSLTLLLRPILHAADGALQERLGLCWSCQAQPL